MSKVVILGDTHFDYSKSNPIFHSYFKKFFSYMFSYMEKNSIKYLIQEGDLFDNKREIRFTTIKEVNEYFFQPIKDLGIDTYVISGNHDTLYKNSSEVNTISLLCPDYITIVDKEPKTLIIGSSTFDLYPWINDSNIDSSTKLAKKSKSDYAIGHFEFAGFPMYPGMISESGMNHTTFSKYKQVFSGHFHTISNKDNICYTGTPYELNWTDCGDTKGFWVLDTETGIKEHIKNPYTLYEKISYTEDMEYDFTNVKDKIVRINVVSKESQKKFDNFLSNVNINSPYSCIVSDINISNSVSESVQSLDILSTKTMIENVVDTLDLSLDKIILKKYILETYSEAMNLVKL